MKKNREINPLEQHFEKLVLGAVCLVLLAVVAMQFLTQPNAVRVGGSDPVPPDQVFDAVKREADNLVARMRSVDPELPEIPEQDVATRFEEVRGLAVADQIELSAIGGKVAIGVFEGQDAGAFDAATTYAMPSLPVPAAIAAQTYRATVDPFVWASNEELRSYLPAEQPLTWRRSASRVASVARGSARASRRTPTGSRARSACSRSHGGEAISICSASRRSARSAGRTARGAPRR